jgi:hypothetical protein
MDTLSEFRVEVQSALNVGDNSSLFPPTTIDRALNRAYIKCARLFRWPQLEDAKLTTTQANVEYYDLPDGWSPDSMYKLQIGTDYYGEEPDFSPMAFQDYLNWKADEDNEDSTEKKWAVHGNQYFIYPTPTASALVISIWGQKNVTKMTIGDDTATTIFSDNMGESDQVGELFSAEAKGILSVAFNKVKQESAKEEKEQPMLEVTDMFGKASVTDTIGRFT